jgi:hypothetical protein
MDLVVYTMRETSCSIKLFKKKSYNPEVLLIIFKMGLCCMTRELCSIANNSDNRLFFAQNNRLYLGDKKVSFQVLLFSGVLV